MGSESLILGAPMRSTATCRAARRRQGRLVQQPCPGSSTEVTDPTGVEMEAQPRSSAASGGYGASWRSPSDYHRSATVKGDTVAMRRSQATIFVPILLSVLAGGCGLGGPPSDAVMIAQLQRERAAFDAIVRMMEEDRIEGELVVNPLRADSAAQRVRREQYRDLVRRTGCERVQRDPVTRRVTFVRRYLTAGGGVAGTGFKDYVYAPAPPAPLRATLDPDDGTRFEDTFRHVDGPWYLCRMRI